MHITIAHFHGTIRFIGETQFAPGRWVGVELVDPVGKNSGTVQDVEYFTCAPQHGIFVRESVVKPLNPVPDTEKRTSRTNVDLNVSVAEDSQGSSDGEPGVEMDVTLSRRFGVSSGRQHSADDWRPPVYPKGHEERQQLVDMVRTSHDSKLQMMFGGIPDETFEKIIDAMFPKPVVQGEKLIQLGDDGDFFYIVKSGQFDIFTRRQARFTVRPGQAMEQEQLVNVFKADAGYAFGELALLYNATRSATIVATQPSEVWCLEREAFRRLVVQSSQEQFRANVDFLRRCDLFSKLNDEQLAALAENIGEEEFAGDEAIIEQGHRDCKMYILRKGAALACIKGDQGEVEVMHYNVGDFFGEIALLRGVTRQASVYCTGPVTCVYITRDTFHRVVGHLQDFLQGHIGTYQSYEDIIASARGSGGLEGTLAAGQERGTATVSFVLQRPTDLGFDEAGEGEALLEKSATQVNRKNRRDRTIAWSAAQGLVFAADLKAAESEAQDAEEGAHEGEAVPDASQESASPVEDEPEPTSLAEKVVQDFKKPHLVTPCDDFAVAKQDFQMFGGLRLGEKFTMDKVVVTAGDVAPTSDGLDEVYKWRGPSWLKGSTHVAVLCQKGQKALSDPTPNQDNYFVLQIRGVGIYGVCDGHGPFGHLVSFRLVQTLPYLLSNSVHFSRDWALALKEAFLAAQQDLLSFCGAHGVNLEASGAAGSVLVCEGPCIHVAHIGDAGAMVASWSRRDTRLILGTKDHKPQEPGERERLEAAGSEVREVDGASFRIYIRGTGFPGLTMSRAFGDTACNGVLQEPTYQQFFMQPEDECYAIVASDGIWEFIDYEKAVELSAKKLRLKGPLETVRFLTEASRKRWAYCCGDYCDDITALLIQWNAKDQSEDNYTVSVTQAPA